MTRFTPIRALMFSALVFTAIAALPALSQTTFSAHTLYTNPGVTEVAAHGDFNNDGRDDLIVSNFATATTPATGQLFLSNGDGTYDAPVNLAQTVYSGQIAVGDFNHDGNLDFAAVSPAGTQVIVYLGHGNGTFTAASAPIATPNGVTWLVAADMNHDGKTDLVIMSRVSGVTSINVWLSNGDGTFASGQAISSGVLDASFGAFIGDFDGDGKPDLAITYTFEGPTTVQVWFGDGAGHLGSPYQLTDPDGDDDRYDSNSNPVGDVNNDGKSDILFYRTKYGLSGTGQFYPQIAVFGGNSSRTLTFSTINTANCPVGINVADYNGDGINDLAYAEAPCTNIGSQVAFVIKPGTGGGSFGAEQTIYTNPYYAGGDMITVKTTQGTKPDLLFSEWTQAQVNPGTAPPQSVVLLSNASTGSFPGCGTVSGVSQGINLCMPSGASASSPVKFSVSAAGPTPMRTVAVWADGLKYSEQLTHAFSNYSFLDQSVSLSQGTHSVTVFGTGWDNTLQQKTFTLNVGTSGSCAAPTTPGVHVCAPANGAYVNTPTEVSAAANVVGTVARMEVWVDGVKAYTETTSPSFDTFISLGGIGYHRYDIYAVNTAGTKYETTVYATSGTGTSCPADPGYDVHICSPMPDSMVSSPMTALATAHITGTLARMEVWVDGVKKFTETTSLTLYTTIPLGSGQHRFDFYAVNTAGTKWETSLSATVP